MVILTVRLVDTPVKDFESDSRAPVLGTNANVIEVHSFTDERKTHPTEITMTDERGRPSRAQLSKESAAYLE